MAQAPVVSYDPEDEDEVASVASIFLGSSPENKGSKDPDPPVAVASLVSVLFFFSGDYHI